MKKVYSFLMTFSLVLLFSSQIAANKDGTILLTATLNGANEAPTPVVTKGKGLVTVIVEEDRSLTINGVWDSLSGPVTNCHFHKGAAGQAGGVVLNLFTYVKGNRIYGKIPNPGKAFLSALFADSIYFNIHTAANGGGEIRGQVLTRTEYHFWTIMGGAFEVPSVTTNALGLASVVVSRSLTKVDYKIVVNGLSGPITAAHFHYGSPTVAGPVAFPLSYNGSVLTGSIQVDSKFIDSIAAGRVYVNVHTAANGGGEIRGQLSWTDGAFAYDALMEGANEAPTPVTSSAKGLTVAWTTYGLDTLQYAVIYTGLTPSAAHFHTGAAGIAGGVIVALTPYTRAPTSAYVDRIAWSNDNLTKLIKGEIYTNIHTTANSGGEIRGQMATSLHEGTVADLCGKQEVPPLTNTASGAGYTSIDPTKSIGYFAVVTNGLSSNATAAHIHKGLKGVIGGVYLNFGATTNNAYSGAFLLTSTTAADSITNGQMYMNVHTALNGGGEIRGQLGKALTPDCLPTGIFELNGETLQAKVYPNPTHDALNLSFGSNETFDAQVVISDLTGRSVTVKNIKVENGDNQLPINMSNVSSGMYFLQVKNNGKIIFSEKIVKE